MLNIQTNDKDAERDKKMKVNYRNNNGSGNTVFLVVVVVLVIAITLFLLFFSGENREFSWKSNTERTENAENLNDYEDLQYEIYYDSGEDTEFCLYRDYIVECSRDGFYLFDKSGNEIFRKNIEFQKPVLKKQGNYLLVADLGGRTAFVIEDKTIKWEETFTNNIINISINRDGYIAIVLKTIGYRNTIRVLAPIGRKLFDWVVADDYVIASEISPFSTELMINRIKTNGISVRSGLEFLDLKSEPFAALESEEEKVFLNAQYIGNSNLAVVTDKEFYLYSDEREIIIQDSFEVVMSVVEFPDKKVALAAQRDGQSLLLAYEPKKESKVLLETELPIINMVAGDGLLLANMGNQVIVLKENGKIVFNRSFESEVLYGSISGKSEIMIVTKKSAEIHKL